MGTSLKTRDSSSSSQASFSLSSLSLSGANPRFAPGAAAWFFFSLAVLCQQTRFRASKSDRSSSGGSALAKVQRAARRSEFLSRPRRRCVVGVFFFVLLRPPFFFFSRARRRKKGLAPLCGTPHFCSNSSSRERTRSLRAACGEKEEVEGREGWRGGRGGGRVGPFFPSLLFRFSGAGEKSEDEKKKEKRNSFLSPSCGASIHSFFFFFPIPK